MPVGCQASAGSSGCVNMSVENGAGVGGLGSRNCTGYVASSLPERMRALHTARLCG